MKRQVSWGAFPFIRLHTHPAGTCLCAFLQTQGIWEWNTEQNLYRWKMCAPVCPNFIAFAVNFTNGETCDLGSLPHHPSQSPIGDLAALQSRWSIRVLQKNTLTCAPGLWETKLRTLAQNYVSTCLKCPKPPAINPRLMRYLLGSRVCEPETSGDLWLISFRPSGYARQEVDHSQKTP